MQLNQSNYKKRKQGQIYHDYVEDFFKRPPRYGGGGMVAELWYVFLFIMGVSLSLGFCVGAGEGSETYTVTRTASNFYQVDYGCPGCYFRTQDCYEMATMDDVEWDGETITFGNGEVCDAKLLKRAY